MNTFKYKHKKQTNPIYTHSIHAGNFAHQERCATQLDGRIMRHHLKQSKRIRIQKVKGICLHLFHTFLLLNIFIYTIKTIKYLKYLRNTVQNYIEFLYKNKRNNCFS